MRLIDADALKEAISDFHQKENERLHTPLWGSVGLNALDRLIDNAPTVSPDMAQVLAYESGKSSDRPKGKWVKLPRYEGDTQPDFKCGNCGYEITYFSEDNFCARCGAEMRGDQDE